MDIKSTSSSAFEAERKSSNVYQLSTGASQVTLPLHGSTGSQETSAVSVPVVQRPLVHPSHHPSAMAFHSGIAFDYDNFPQIVSVCWPVIDYQSGMSAIGRDGPERGVTHPILTVQGVQAAPVFTWDTPKPVAKDPVISAPGKKAPIGITVCNSRELVPNELVTSNPSDLVFNNTANTQHDMTSVPPNVEISGDKNTKETLLEIIQLSADERNCQSQTQGSCNETTEQTTSPNVEVSGDKNIKESLFERIQLSVDGQRSNCTEAADCKNLGRKRTMNEAPSVASHLSEDGKQSALEAREIVCPKRKKSDHTCCSIGPKVSGLDGSECKSDTIMAAISTESNTLLSSTENKQEEDKTDVDLTARISAMIESNEAKTTEDAPTVTGDQVKSSANITDMSDASCVFSFFPYHQSDGDSNKPTGNMQHNVVGPENKQENVWELIRRIRYIKSRLDCAESDYRKKRMLKTIVSLQKRVKAIVKGMHKEKEDPGNGQQEKSNSEAPSGQESAENSKNMKNADLDSQGTDSADQGLQTNDFIADKGGISKLPDAHQSSLDPSKDTTERKCEVQNNSEQQTAKSPSALIVNHNDVTGSGTNTADEFISNTTMCNSKDLDNNGNNSNSQEDCERLSLIDSNGVDDSSLRLSYGIGLECSPCVERAAPAFGVDDSSDMHKSTGTTVKKMKTSSLSEKKGVKDKTDTRSKDVTQPVCNVTQCGALEDERDEDVTQNVCNVTQDDALEDLVPNERDEDNVKLEKKNVSQNKMDELIFMNEFIKLRDTEDTTLLDSTDIALEVTVDNNKEEPLSLLGDEVLVEERGDGNDRQINEDSGEDYSTVDRINNMDGESTLTSGNEYCSEDVEIDKMQPGYCTDISEKNTYSEEIQDIEINLGVEDNWSEYKEEHCSSVLESVLQDKETQGYSEELQDIEVNLGTVDDNSNKNNEEYCSSLLESVHQELTQGFTSPAIHNPSGRQEDVEVNLGTVEDNWSEYKEEHCSSLLESVLQDKKTQGFTSPAIHNPSGRQEDVDLLQSLQIREARILNLTRKRDMLLNLTGLKLK